MTQTNSPATTFRTGVSAAKKSSGTETMPWPKDIDENVRRALACHDLDTGSLLKNIGEEYTGQRHFHAANGSKLSPIGNFLTITPIAPTRPTLHPLQEWEGYVVSIESDEFVARLVDVTAGHSHESEEAIIPLEEISDQDASRISVGSIFRWVIGYERSVEGTKRRVSHIVFRDLPRITESDLKRGQNWAQWLKSAFDQ